MYTRKIAYVVIGLLFVLCGSGLSFADYYGSVTDAIGDNDPRNRAGGAYDFASGTARVTGGNLIFSTTFAPGTFSSENWRAAYIYVSIDLDRDPSTGNPGINADHTDSAIFGTDYFVAWGGSSKFPGYGLYVYRAAEGDWLAVDTNLSTTYSVSADDPSVGIATVTIPLSDFGGASVGTFNFEFQVKRVVSSNAITTTLDYMPNPGSFGTTAPVPDPSKSAMEKYKADFKKEMKAFDKKIAKLGKKVEEQGSNAGTEAKESWNDLEAKQANAKSKLKSLSKEAWDKTKTEADVAREDLRKAYDKSVSYFK